ncbi:hypothetical protein ACT8ZV_22430 [Nocardioides sp. MAHUQ-72]|uniref:hypothetical protein n=1 Tax=unclassified Nocardioides TaxID=2615069 RepID=UPI003624515C
MWQEEEEPEEDPGVIYVVLEVDDQTVAVEESGNVLMTDDPRDLDLRVSVDELLCWARGPSR